MKKSEKKTPENNFDLQAWEVLRAHEFDGGNISFDMKVNGVTIYGMGLIWNADRKEYWVSFPARKGKDGKYYKHAWFPVDEALQANIEKRIEEMLS